VDFIKATVLNSIGEPVELGKMASANSLWVEIILHSSVAGYFEELVIDDKIKSSIVEIELLVQKGDKVEAFSSANKMVGTAILNIVDESIFQYVRDNIHDLVKVRVVE